CPRSSCRANSIRSRRRATARKWWRRCPTHACSCCEARATTWSAPVACRSWWRASSTPPMRPRSTAHAWTTWATCRRSPRSTAGSPEHMIIAEHLRKTFPGKGKDKTPVVAVDDVGFEARDGEITGLLGPNGAGKTTTLRMLYTLMRPEGGRVLVDGKDVASEPEAARRALGVLPDARGVYKRLTARENIRYF